MACINIPTGSTTAPTVNVFEDSLTAPSSISWRSVFAGVVVALSVSLVLNLLGMGIGFSTIDPATGDTPSMATISIWAAVWYVMTAVVAAFAGGWVAAHLANRHYGNIGGWHGLITWALTSMVVIYLASSAIGTAVTAAGNAAQGTGMMYSRSSSDPIAALDNQVRAYSGTDQRALADVTTQNIRQLIRGEPANAQQLRDQAVVAAMRANNMPEDQARMYVAQLERDYRVVAEAAAKSIASISLMAALTLIFSALAGWMGGNHAGTRRRTEVYTERVHA